MISSHLNSVLSLLFISCFLYSIKLMNHARTAMKGNILGAISMLGVILITLVSNGILNNILIWASIITGLVIGCFFGVKVSMIQMPQLVAFLNGTGGGASAITSYVVLSHTDKLSFATIFTGCLALAIGGITLSGSLIAAAKLHRIINQKPVVIRGHTFLSVLSMVLLVIFVIFAAVHPNYIFLASALLLINSLIFGILLTVRIGGADMPVTISLLNSLSGLAASVAGFVIGNSLLIAVGAIVGSAGLILTREMCRAMNRSLVDIIFGLTTTHEAGVTPQVHNETTETDSQPSQTKGNETVKKTVSADTILHDAQNVVIVPGYGMAVSQAQAQVKHLYETLLEQNKNVSFGIHPVAGRMPGHMYVLLTEVDIPYETLLDMEAINPKFRETDVVVVIGANDVINPAAITAVGTPIYGMPILNVNEAKNIIICNIDTEPGYAGVENPLYTQDNVALLLGDAKATVAQLAK